MGFVRGQKVTAILNAPLRDPIKYSIMGYEVSLRRSEAAMVEVITQQEAQKLSAEWGKHSTSDNDFDYEKVIDAKIREINIALVGNPNSGKTSLFNALSGRREHVGNYSGVTVDAKSGSFKYKDYHINITDLPGTYALSAYTPEEIYVRCHLVEKLPDVVNGCKPARRHSAEHVRRAGAGGGTARLRLSGPHDRHTDGPRCGA